jgi:hypothetical protein
MAVLLLVVVTLAISHWLVEPFVVALTPLLTLAWLGWGLLLLLAWLFAGGRS